MNKKILSILRFFCPPRLLEEIEGDLLQKFERDLNPPDRYERSDGCWRRRANRKLLWNVIRFFRPGILLRNKLSIGLIQAYMIQNYLKISTRNLISRKPYLFINVVGLALGIATCLVIEKYVEFETSFERFNTNAKNIYRTVSSFYTDGKIESYCGYDLGPSLLDNFPEIKKFARIHGNGSVVIIGVESQKQLKFKERDILIVDSTFLDIFPFYILKGNLKSALAKPNSVVITKSVALKYFGSSVDPIGKTLTLTDGWIPGHYEVSAVVEDTPPNTHFKFDLLLPMHNLLQTDFYRNDHACWDNFHTYLELYPSADISKMNEKISAFEVKYRGKDKTIKKSNLQFQPLLDIHFSPDVENPGSQRNRVYFFALVAIFILVIAWINYINLSTACAMDRAREVGIKKALGVFRRQLIFQFFFESALINAVSIVFALIVAWLTLPLLNQLIDQSLVFDFFDLKLWITILTVFFAGSFGAGAYPAMVLSSYKASEVIKGKIAKSTKGFSLRSSLVAFQFAASMILIVATLVVYKQVNFMKNQNKSFETSQIIIIKGPELSETKGLGERVSSFKNEVKQFSFVDKICTSFSLPGEDASLSAGMRRKGTQPEESRVGNVYWIDPDFIRLYDIPLIAGKIWDPLIKSEMESVIINEEAVRVFQLGSNEHALKEQIETPIGTFSIIGVVKNHHWTSLKQPFVPMILGAEKISSTSISIKLKGNIQENLEIIKAKYKESFPDDSFSYYFLDDAYNAQYKEEARIEKLFSIFSILSVLIGCLGLWGLASFATLHRLKEISIRKVLGASVNSILILLSRQFLKPLLIGSLVVIPLALIVIPEWLDQFPYRIQLTFDLLLIPLVILVVIAMVTVSFQTVRAAIANPIDSLRNE